MSFFVRMLERQKWEKNNLSELGYSKTPADTITGDLRTVSNNLSLWSIETIDRLHDAILALAVMRNKLTRLDVLIIEKNKIEEKGLEVLNTPENGKTPLIGFEEFHYDLIDLNYDKLGDFSQIIIESVIDEELCIRFPKGEISKILYDGFQDKKFSLEELDDGLKEELEKVIARRKSLE